jgi:putative transcriptional regulator
MSINNSNEIEIKGKIIDNQTRCIHYHSPLDVIAIKFKCCDSYYPCYQCHEEEADHPSQVWKKEDFETKAIICGDCKTEMSIAAYKSSDYKCPFCSVNFNPKCSLHDHLYFEMSALKAGLYIKSTSALNDSFFEDTTILIVEHNETGSVGYVTNKPFGKSLNDLIEFNHAKAIPLMDGGPVDRDHLFVLHKRPDLIDEGKQVSDGLYFGGNMKQVIEAINTGNANQQDIQLFIGYCGWDKGELEAEVEEGSWTIS